MPTVQPGESRRDFVNRCVPEVIDDGTAADGAQGAAICNQMWRDRNKEDERVLDHERDISAELQALAEQMELEGVDPIEAATFTDAADSMLAGSLDELEDELRSVEVPEHMRNPSLMETEDDLLQEP